jgi:hypothetical protein
MRAIPYIMATLIVVIGLTIAFNVKKHVEVISTATELATEKAQLQKDVLIIKHNIKSYDSIVAKKDSTIKTQKKSIFGLLKEVATKMMVTTSVVTVHDTVYITEKKNFWGKTKRSVQLASSVDSSSTVEEKVLASYPIDTIKNDTIK